MKKLFIKIKNIPLYGWIVAASLICYIYILYRFADILAKWTGTINYAFTPKIPFDDLIPLIPFFMIIYVLSYAFWVISFLVLSIKDKENYINFIFLILISSFIGFLIFWLAPTKMDRNLEGLLEVANSNEPFSWLLKFIYYADGGEIAYDLFPSYHCLTSLCCFLGVYKRKEIHFGFRIFSLVMVFLISLSTVFTKQHYVLDVLGGFIIPIFVYIVINFINPGKKYFVKTRKEIL